MFWDTPVGKHLTKFDAVGLEEIESNLWRQPLHRRKTTAVSRECAS